MTMDAALFYQVEKVLLSLKEVLNQINDEQYTYKNELVGASIGEHSRHIIELYTCLINNYNEGVVNYDKRERNQLIQSKVTVAIDSVHYILKKMYQPNRKMLLQTNTSLDDNFITIETNYFRELLYNIEHTVHHMALMRIGLAEINTINVSDDFGVAASTIKYRSECAQ
jgi:uncharacterized damage-inducible protein DinB